LIAYNTKIELSLF